MRAAWKGVPLAYGSRHGKLSQGLQCLSALTGPEVVQGCRSSGLPGCGEQTVSL